MVTTGDIHKAEEALKDAQTGLSKDESDLDDVMLAMDVVDTLRHEKLMVEKELFGEERRQALVERLRDIYDAQGIQVSDDVLMDGVLALEEQRFVFDPPKKSFGLSLAKVYINRARWLPLLTIFMAVIAGGWAVNHFAFERPAQLEAARMETLFGKTLPNQINAERDAAISIAATDDVRARVNDIHGLAETAIRDKDAKGAERYAKELAALNSEIGQSYELRVVNRPNEMSGVFRVNDASDQVRNYYLIVEATNAAGDAVKATITSEEDRMTRRTNIWGVRVPDHVFQRVADDKRDDFIIQKNLVGVKKRGYLDPEFSIETSGGTILEW